MENNFEQIENNTYFVSAGFYTSGVKNISDSLSVDVGRIDYLRQSIEILESGNFSKRELKRCLSEVGAPTFWNDLFYLNTYKRAGVDIKNSIETAHSEFKEHPDRDDILTACKFQLFIERSQQDLNNINTIIELTEKFRSAILEAIPNLETDFSGKLEEHVKLQIEAKKKSDERATRKEQSKKQSGKQTPPVTDQ